MIVDPQERYDELQRLLRTLDTRDPFHQAELVVKLHACWGLLSDIKKNELLPRVAVFIPRCQETANPTGMLLSILGLPTEEDIRRALTSGVGIALKERGVGAREEPLPEPAYLWTPQEEIYREVTGWLRKYLHYAKWNYVPLGFHFWSAVCALGAVCKRQVYFDTGQFFILPNWYVLLVGDSGATGKSAAAKVAVELIERLNRQICPSDNEIDRLPFGRQFTNCLPNDVTIPRIINKLSELKYNPSPHPTEEILPDGTKRAKFPAANQPVDATAFIFIDELASLFGKESYKPGQVAAFLTYIKECDRYEKSTSTGGDKYLYNLAVSMIACCAPAWLKEAISPTILGGGFADRSTYIFREPVWDRMILSSPHDLIPRDPIVGERLATDLRAIAELDTKKVPSLSPEATTLGRRIFVQLVEDMRARYGEIGAADDMTSANRAYNDVLRLAMLLAVSDVLGTRDWPRITIEPHHLDLAKRIMQMEEFSMRRFIERSQESPLDPLEIKVHMAACGLVERDECISRSDFTAYTMKGYKVAQFMPAVKQLVEEGRLEAVQVGGRERRYRPKGHECKSCLHGVLVEAENLRF